MMHVCELLPGDNLEAMERNSLDMERVHATIYFKNKVGKPFASTAT